MGAYDNLSLGSTGSCSYAGISGALTPAVNTYRLGGGGGTLYINNVNVITGVGKILAVNGPGTVVLQSDNDYSGGTILNGGTLSYTNDASIGGAATPITFSGGMLQTPAGTADDLGAHSPFVNWSSFNGGFDVPDGATLTITQIMGGSGSLTKGGLGTLILKGQSTYSGGTNIYSGILKFSGGPSRLPTTTSIVVTTGGTLNLGFYSQSTTGDVTIAGGSILTGTILKTGPNPYYAQAGTVSAVLGGSGGLTKSTTGTLTISASANYTGNTAINGGTLKLSGSGRLPTGSTVTVSNGGTLDLGGVTQSMDNAADLIISGGTVQNGTISRMRQSYQAQAGAVSAVLSGNSYVGLTKTTTGTLVLSNVNTYRGGTLIQGGTLQLSGGDNRLSTSGAITVSNNFLQGAVPRTTGTLDLGGNNQTTTGIITIDDGTIQNGTLINNGANYVALSGSVSATLSGSAGLTKNNGPDMNSSTPYPNNTILTLSGPNNYAGGTIIQNGTLELAGINRLPTTGAITITNGILDLLGNSQTTSGAVSIQGGEVDNGTIVKSGSPYDGQGGIVSAVLDGTAGLTKTSTNALTLIAANTYNGGTTISAGTLQLNGGNDRLYTNGAITITGGVLDFGINIQHTSAAVSFQGGIVQNGTIVKSGAAYDAQAGFVSAALQGAVGLTKTTAGILTLTGQVSYTGTTNVQAGTLQINNGLSTVLAAVTGTSAGTLGIGNTSTVTAASVSVGTVTLGPGSTLVIRPLPGGPTAGGAMTPVPEPSTLLMLAIAAIALIGAAWRGKK